MCTISYPPPAIVIYALPSQPTVIFCDNVRWRISWARLGGWGKVEVDAKEAAALGKCQLTWIVWISWMLWWQPVWKAEKKRRPKVWAKIEMKEKQNEIQVLQLPRETTLQLSKKIFIKLEID